ncbi:hypothetical protein [Streptomyces sp. SDr-06]|uniref:DUF6197 family protein n=1 Tax=Streptomyces sp. SDr-06 TaxID=2267702 RepID=UPI0011C0547D|nr:hypothetical protein [Streptomyces sp. SDr-06]
MTMTKAPEVLLADVVDKAYDVIDANGYCKTYLYDTKQAAGGTSLKDCRVDLFGAINIAVHGTPRWVGGSNLVADTEKAVTTDCGAVSLAAWMTQKGHNKREALALLKRTSARLRLQAVTKA